MGFFPFGPTKGIDFKGLGLEIGKDFCPLGPRSRLFEQRSLYSGYQRFFPCAWGGGGGGASTHLGPKPREPVSANPLIFIYFYLFIFLFFLISPLETSASGLK